MSEFFFIFFNKFFQKFYLLLHKFSEVVFYFFQKFYLSLHKFLEFISLFSDFFFPIFLYEFSKKLPIFFVIIFLSLR